MCDNGVMVMSWVWGFCKWEKGYVYLERDSKILNTSPLLYSRKYPPINILFFCSCSQTMFFTSIEKKIEIFLNFFMKKKAYRTDKNRPWETNEVIVSGDLMKVTMCPEMPGSKKAIFAKRIVLCNETFTPVGGQKNGKAVRVL